MTSTRRVRGPHNERTWSWSMRAAQVDTVHPHAQAGLQEHVHLGAAVVRRDQGFVPRAETPAATGERNRRAAQCVRVTRRPSS